MIKKIILCCEYVFLKRQQNGQNPYFSIGEFFAPVFLLFISCFFLILFFVSNLDIERKQVLLFFIFEFLTFLFAAFLFFFKTDKYFTFYTDLDYNFEFLSYLNDKNMKKIYGNLIIEESLISPEIVLLCESKGFIYRPHISSRHDLYFELKRSFLLCGLDYKDNYLSYYFNEKELIDLRKIKSALLLREKEVVSALYSNNNHDLFDGVINNSTFNHKTNIKIDND